MAKAKKAGGASTREKPPASSKKEKECAKLFIVDDLLGLGATVLTLFKRKDGTGDVSGGQFEKGETDPVKVAIRETLAETGLNPHPEDLEFLEKREVPCNRGKGIKVVHFYLWEPVFELPKVTLSSEHTRALWLPPSAFCNVANMPATYAEVAEQHLVAA